VAQQLQTRDLIRCLVLPEVVKSQRLSPAACRAWVKIAYFQPLEQEPMRCSGRVRFYGRLHWLFQFLREEGFNVNTLRLFLRGEAAPRLTFQSRATRALQLNRGNKDPTIGRRRRRISPPSPHIWIAVKLEHLGLELQHDDFFSTMV
jgi:hypothetical protein